MGKSNRQRRKAKQRKRKEASRRPPGRNGPAPANTDYDESADRFYQPPSDRELADSYWSFLAFAPQEGGERTRVVGQLMAMEARVAYRSAASLMAGLVASLWERHWLPAEVIRHVRRSTSATGADLAGAAIAVDHAARKPETLHVHWRQHITELDLPDVPKGNWLQSFATVDYLRARNLTADALVLLVADVLRACAIGTTLQEVIPPPGSASARTESVLADRTPTASAMLDKVRHLLAQAESTTFDSEAEAFTAKAQELMARHSLDEALVWARSESSDRPAVTRIPIDDPYAEAKRLLLHIVAETARCRAVAFSGLGLVSVIGFDADLRSVETLFTSLLVQAQSALHRTAASAPPGSHRRSRGFRSSFLMAYADRIGERLTEVNDHVRQDVQSSSDDDLLPVLANRSLAVDDEVDRLFGELQSSRFSGGRDIAGIVEGRRAADQAELNSVVTR